MQTTIVPTASGLLLLVARLCPALRPKVESFSLQAGELQSRHHHELRLYENEKSPDHLPMKLLLAISASSTGYKK